MVASVWSATASIWLDNTPSKTSRLKPSPEKVSLVTSSERSKSYADVVKGKVVYMESELSLTNNK